MPYYENLHKLQTSYRTKVLTKFFSVVANFLTPVHRHPGFCLWWFCIACFDCIIATCWFYTVLRGLFCTFAQLLMNASIHLRHSYHGLFYYISRVFDVSHDISKVWYATFTGNFHFSKCLVEVRIFVLAKKRSSWIRQSYIFHGQPIISGKMVANQRDLGFPSTIFYITNINS